MDNRIFLQGDSAKLPQDAGVLKLGVFYHFPRPNTSTERTAPGAGTENAPPSERHSRPDGAQRFQSVAMTGSASRGRQMVKNVRRSLTEISIMPW